jgi:FkbM family methyltransferase
MMTLQGILYWLGIRPAPRSYGSAVVQAQLAGYGVVELARWLHPSEGEKTLDPAALHGLESFLAPGDFCVDIGAHSGDTTVPMALVVGPQGCVLALEPNRYVYATLQKNASLNKGMTNIATLMAAATETNGKFHFQYSDSGFCNGGLHKNISLMKHRHHFRLEVTGVRLEEVLRIEYASRLARLRFIKVDTEGYDLFVLKSLLRIIEDFRPHVRAEVYQHTSADYRRELFDLFATRGYAVHRVNSESDLAGPRLEAGALMEAPHYDIFCIPAS